MPDLSLHDTVSPEAPHPEGEPKPDLIALEVPVPPGLAAAFGYRYGARFVTFHWEPGGDDVFFDDGRHSGTGDGRSFLAYLRHRHVALHLDPFNFGGSDEEADYVLVLDREQDLASVIPIAAARTFLKSQHSPPPELTPDQLEQARRRSPRPFPKAGGSRRSILKRYTGSYWNDDKPWRKCSGTWSVGPTSDCR